MARKEDILTRVSERTKSESTSKHVTIILSLVAMALAVFLLRQIGIAITADKTPLNCTYAATDAHTHDESCYRNGLLVCPVPEREEHHHTDACYEEHRTLVCGQDEGDGHVHDESCYEVTQDLVCGLEETTGPHVHTSDCFETEEEEPPVVYDQDVKDASDNVIVSVHAEVPAGALPPGTTMVATPIDPQTVNEAVQEEIKKDGSTDDVVAFTAVDITFLSASGTEVEPAMPVTVTMTSPAVADEATDSVIVHIDDENNTETLETFDEDAVREKDLPDGDDQVSFEAESSPSFALVSVRRSIQLTASDGQRYTIDIECPPASGIPSDAILVAREIEDSSDEYYAYRAASEEALGMPVAFVRLFDISIYDHDWNEIQPADGTAVNVSIRLDDTSSGTLSEDDETHVIHFGEDIETIDSQAADNTVSFEATGFSVYAIVSPVIPEAVATGNVANLSELASHTDRGFLLSVVRQSPYGTTYFMNTLNNNNAIKYTERLDSAATWYFEPVNDGTDGLYRMRTQIGDLTQYLENHSGNLVRLSSTGTVFELSNTPVSGKFYIKAQGSNKWLQYSNGGLGFRMYTDNSNAYNARIILTYSNTGNEIDDPFSLNGESYGIAYQAGMTTATAIMASEMPSSAAPAKRLAGFSMAVRPDVVGQSDSLFVAEDSEISQWTFYNISGSNYILMSVVNGEERYLAADENGLYLVPDPGEAAAVTVSLADSVYGKRYSLAIGGKFVSLLEQQSANGYSLTNAVEAGSWFHLVEESSLVQDSDFQKYVARKVNISDTNAIKDGDSVIIYTRIWNAATLKYDYYFLDYDGTLVQCTETGDSIQWMGNKVNTALWNFTEYHYADGTPNYYYELQNAYSGQYIAPQIGGGQVMSDSTIGINLNGRRYGDDYTTIIAWDDPYYEYAGLKVSGGRIVSCPLSQSSDFYFALVSASDYSDKLTTVATLDGTEYGITMKMIDFNNPKTGGATSPRDSVQNPFFGGDTSAFGMMSTNLVDGYPVTTAVTNNAGHSLAELFNDMTDVNHLFLQSVYNESGYFEYNSTSNFAHLNEDGTFTVYDQLGAISDYNTITGKHGQFMPYNDLTEGKFCSFTNQTNVLAEPLDDSNARKGERLYDIGRRSEVDYQFGMQMEAGFTQTTNGLDAWGNDIIFEFSGDDDFWLYVDGELVLDIGGVHAASVGSVNFRTGDVMMKIRNVKGGTDRERYTTLYQLFREHYVARGMSEEEVAAQLDEVFEAKVVDGRSVYVFRDYTRHDMKMFYMERGAGASNLYMRFNLASVKPGTVTLGKTISGTDKADYSLAEFPYQIWYTRRADGESQPHLLTERASDDSDAPYNAIYSGKNVPVKYAASYMPPGGSNPYSCVFFLKAGQQADITFPVDDVVNYWVVECGVRSNIYDIVTVNQATLTGEESQNDGRMDYSTPPATPDDQPRLMFDNHVSSDALRTLTITKRLYDVDGTTLVTDDPTQFSFRLYLTSENNEMSYANMYPYFVKDAHGNYCAWDAQTQSFASIGKTDYAHLTAEEIERCTFHTSPSGSISKIPANHSVEVRDLVIGVQFQVVERANEIPAGYILREDDGYTRIGGSYFTGETPNSGIIRDNSDPAIEVRNQRGWGLTAVKQWSDNGFMPIHDPIYFAVYVDDGNGNLSAEPIEGTVHQLASGATSTYWFFWHLLTNDFSRYVVREVLISEANPTVASDGTVANPGTVTPIDAGGTLSVDAKARANDTARRYSYEVGYVPGQVTGTIAGLDNVKTDTVTNSRSGIRIVKTDLLGNPLAGATFSFKDDDGHNVGEASYTSDANGFVTVAYLADGDYELKETASPTTYHGLEAPLGITISGTDCTLTGDAADMCDYVAPSGGEMATIYVRNKPFTLQFIKANDDGTPLADAHFELYAQVKDSQGNPTHAYFPMEGYDDLVTDAHGVIPSITQELAPGSYYLHETEAPEGYVAVDEYLRVTIHKNGTVTCDDSKNWTVQSTAGEYAVTYVITVTDEHVPTVTLNARKQWLAPGGLVASEWPAGTTVTLGLFERDPSTHELTAVNRPGTDSAYEIELDNVVDILDEPVAGTARFNGLPIGPRYVVQEIDCPHGYHVQYDTEGQDYEVFDANGDATVSNVPDTVSVSVTKAWHGNDVPSDASATLRLYSYLTNEADAQPVESVPAVTLPTGAPENVLSWNASFSKLLKYDSTGLVEVHYVVREISGTPGYQPSYGDGQDHAVDGGTITNMPMKQDFSFSKEWVGLAASERWPQGTTISVSLTRTLATSDGTSVSDDAFAATYSLSALADGTGATCEHVEGTSVPKTWDGADATANWDGTTFTLADLPVRGSVGSAVGTWTYHVSEAQVGGYETAYRIHGSVMEGATEIGDGGTIVNTSTIAKTYILPNTGKFGKAGIMLIGTAIILAPAFYLGMKWIIGRKEDAMEP